MSNSRNRRKRKQADLRVAEKVRKVYERNNLRIDRELEENPYALLSLSPPHLRIKRAFRLAKAIDSNQHGGRKVDRAKLRLYLQWGMSVKQILENRLMY
jgi:hypothetical protein